MLFQWVICVIPCPNYVQLQPYAVKVVGYVCACTPKYAFCRFFIICPKMGQPPLFMWTSGKDGELESSGD